MAACNGRRISVGKTERKEPTVITIERPPIRYLAFYSPLSFTQPELK